MSDGVTSSGGGSGSLPDPNPVPQKVEGILKFILENQNNFPSDENAAEELAKLLILVEKVRFKRPDYLSYLEIAIKGLYEKVPNISFSRELRGKMRKELLPWYEYWSGKFFLTPDEPGRVSPTAYPVLGLFFLCVFILNWDELDAFLNQFFSHGLDGNAKGIARQGAMAFMGFLGSVVSILVRLKEFDQEKNVAPVLLVLIGFFKPIVGAIFGLFVLFVIEGDLLPFLKIPTEDKASSFLLAIAFVSGFSERFAKDISGKIADQANNSKEDESKKDNS